MENTKPIKKFITKTAVKIVIFAVILILVTSLLQSISPIMSNQIALGQMQNSDEAFVFMNTYNKIRPIANIGLTVIGVLFAGTIARDTYKFIKSFENNNEKEKN